MTDSVEEVSVWPEHASALPWTYHRQLHAGQHWDRIEDAHGNTVVEHVGHIDGPAICAAVNSRRSIANTAGEGETAEQWRDNVEALLSSGDPDVIRCHEGGGPESLIGSLVLTVMRTRNARDKALSALTSPPADHFADAGNMVETTPAGAVEPVAYIVTDKMTSFDFNRRRAILADDPVAASWLLDKARFDMQPIYLHPAPEHNDVRVERPEIATEADALKRLAEGDRIVYSRDGEMAWFQNGDRAWVADDVVMDLHLSGAVVTVNEGMDEDWHEWSQITDTGRAALSAALKKAGA